MQSPCADRNSFASLHGCMAKSPLDCLHVSEVKRNRIRGVPLVLGHEVDVPLGHPRIQMVDKSGGLIHRVLLDLFRFGEVFGSESLGVRHALPFPDEGVVAAGPFPKECPVGVPVPAARADLPWRVAGGWPRQV